MMKSISKEPGVYRINNDDVSITNQSNITSAEKSSLSSETSISSDDSSVESSISIIFEHIENISPDDYQETLSILQSMFK